MSSARVARWGGLLLALSCEQTSPPEQARRERGEVVPPAAHGAIGAYAKRGRTPWTDRAAPETRGPSGGGPPMLPMAPQRRDAEDGGVAL